MTHKIQVTALSGTQDAARVKMAFAQLFRIPEEKAEKLLARLPLVIKEGVDEPTAQKYRSNLEKIGLRVEIIAPAAAAAAAVPAMAAAGAPAAAAAPAAMAAAQATGWALEPIAPPPGEEKPASAATAPDNPGVFLRPPVKKTQERAGLEFRIDGRPDFAFLTVQLPAGRTLKVEASAMATMDTTLTMKTRLRGGLGRFLTGESIFVNEFTADAVPGEIGIAPAAPGDMGHVFLRGDTVFLQNSAFVACDPGVNLETKWQGLTKGFFSGESFFLVRASGHGDLWFNTYGGLIELDIDGDYVVDTGNIVAFTDGLDYRISKIGGYKSLFFSGEGLVCRFSGKGKVWIQTRAAGAFVSWAHAYRPVKTN